MIPSSGFDDRSARRITRTVRDAERQPRRANRGSILAVGTGGSGVRKIRTPGGGIPKRNQTTLVPGSATCLLWEWIGETRDIGDKTLLVYNDLKDDAPGDVDGFCYREKGKWLWLGEICED